MQTDTNITFTGWFRNVVIQGASKLWFIEYFYQIILFFGRDLKRGRVLSIRVLLKNSLSPLTFHEVNSFFLIDIIIKFNDT